MLSHFDEFLERYNTLQPEYLSVDTETTGVTYFDKPFCVTFALTDGEETYSAYLELEEPVEDFVKEILARTPNLVFHNTKFDLQKLALVGLIEYGERDPQTIWDTECMYHLLDEHGTKGLKDLAERILGETTDEEEVLKVERRKLKLKKADGYHLLPREVLIPYARKDAEFTIRLHNVLQPRVLQSKELGLLNSLEQRLTYTLLRMESQGMGIDVEYVQRTAKAYAHEALKQELIIRDITGNDDFNPNSPKQIAEYFVSQGIETESTDKATLKALDHELSNAILELRHLRKIHGTYLKAMLDESRDGILHPWFRQHGTRTGRMSSGGAAE